MGKFVYFLCAAFIAATCQGALSLSIRSHSNSDEKPANELVLFGDGSLDSNEDAVADIPIVNAISINPWFNTIENFLECTDVGHYKDSFSAMGSAIYRMNDSVLDFFERVVRRLTECPENMGFFKCIANNIIQFVSDSERLSEDVVDFFEDFGVAAKELGHEVKTCLTKPHK